MLPPPTRAVVLAVASAVADAPAPPSNAPPDEATALATVFCPVGAVPLWLCCACTRMLPPEVMVSPPVRA